jgi:hypothetical protein
MHPVMIKFVGLIIASMIIFSPSDKPKPTNDIHKLENAQAIADRSGKTVKVWMDKNGHVAILLDGEVPTSPYTMLHSTWKPR